MQQIMFEVKIKTTLTYNQQVNLTDKMESRIFDF